MWSNTRTFYGYSTFSYAVANAQTQNFPYLMFYTYVATLNVKLANNASSYECREYGILIRIVISDSSNVG